MVSKPKRPSNHKFETQQLHPKIKNIYGLKMILKKPNRKYTCNDSNKSTCEKYVRDKI